MNKFQGFFVSLRMTFAVLLFFPVATMAANVGFLPSTGIWFSRTIFSPKETVRIYTVVFNNDYARLDGTVAFYDNNNIIDTVLVKSLAKESAQEIRVFWQPSEGKHAISARFLNAMATDDKGQTFKIDSANINSQTGLPLIVGQGDQVSPVSPDAVALPSSPAESSLIGSTLVEVEKQNSKLAITASAVLGEKVVASTTTSSVSAQVAAASSSSSFEDLFAKNREVLDKAKSAVDTVSSTAAKVGEVYGAAKNVIAKGQEVYDQAKAVVSTTEDWLQKFHPVTDKIKAGWNRITHDGEPRRTAIAVGVIIFVLFLIWRRIRQGMDQQF